MSHARPAPSALEAALAALVVALAGCAGTAPRPAARATTQAPGPAIAPLHAALVMPGAAPGRLDTGPGWEFSRNDVDLGAPPRPLDPAFSVSESRKRQRQYIQSGRLRENTVISTGTWSRRSGR